MIWVNYNVLTTQSCHSEFFGAYACKTNRFPYFGNISFLSCIKSSL